MNIVDISSAVHGYTIVYKAACFFCLLSFYPMKNIVLSPELVRQSSECWWISLHTLLLQILNTEADPVQAGQPCWLCTVLSRPVLGRRGSPAAPSSANTVPNGIRWWRQIPLTSREAAEKCPWVSGRREVWTALSTKSAGVDAHLQRLCDSLDLVPAFQCQWDCWSNWWGYACQGVTLPTIPLKSCMSGPKQMRPWFSTKILSVCPLLPIEIGIESISSIRLKMPWK